jgi:hypothetical protein
LLSHSVAKGAGRRFSILRSAGRLFAYAALCWPGQRRGIARECSHRIKQPTSDSICTSIESSIGSDAVLDSTSDCATAAELRHCFAASISKWRFENVMLSRAKRSQRTAICRHCKRVRMATPPRRKDQQGSRTKATMHTQMNNALNVVGCQWPMAPSIRSRGKVTARSAGTHPSVNSKPLADHPLSSDILEDDCDL